MGSCASPILDGLRFLREYRLQRGMARMAPTTQCRSRGKRAQGRLGDQTLAVSPCHMPDRARSPTQSRKDKGSRRVGNDGDGRWEGADSGGPRVRDRSSSEGASLVTRDAELEAVPRDRRESSEMASRGCNQTLECPVPAGSPIRESRDIVLKKSRGSCESRGG
jgi:hypothetical protein